MTLKFIGSMDPQLTENMLEEFRDHMQFETVTYEVDCIQLFPSVTRPKVIAAMVVKNERLNELVRMLNQLTAGYGLPAKQEYFCGHLTLARCAPNFPRDLHFEPLPVNMTEKLTSITFFRSDARHSGPVYTPLETILCRANKP
jgi:2'-5' RNA ligase